MSSRVQSGDRTFASDVVDVMVCGDFTVVARAEQDGSRDFGTRGDRARVRAADRERLAAWLASHLRVAHERAYYLLWILSSR